MEWQNFKSNSIEGNNFILGMMNTEKKWQKARELFTKFIKENGFTAWHIHDGWVMNGYNNGNILHHEDIRIVWIESHAGYSHVCRCPDVGEKIIIVSNSPDGDEVKPFDLYCYEVIEKSKSLSNEIKLKRIEIKQAVFNQEENNYQFYIKKRWDIFSFLKRKVKSKGKSSACL